jgi:hypothetical protein
MAAVLEGRDNTKIVAFSEVILDSTKPRYPIAPSGQARLGHLFDAVHKHALHRGVGLQTKIVPSLKLTDAMPPNSNRLYSDCRSSIIMKADVAKW